MMWTIFFRNRSFFIFWAVFIAIFFFSACTLSPPSRSEVEHIRPPEKVAIPSLIMGAGLLTEAELSSFLLLSNGDLEDGWVRNFSAIYIREAKREGVNHDIAFAQMCLETGYLHFGNLVTADMHNYCGLGAIGGDQRGERFATVELGVRAHIQHLKAYGSDEPLVGELIDPRFRWVRRASAPTFYGLAGTWASDPLYGEKIERILGNMYKLAGY